MDFQQIRDFVNPAVAQATGIEPVENLSMPVPVAYVPVQLVIDGALSLTSENPVQNKVIAVAIQQLDGRITAIEGQFSEGVTEAVNNWLDAHPEATTTVQDGAITYAKLDANLKGEVDQISDLKSALKQDNTNFSALINNENVTAIWVSKAIHNETGELIDPGNVVVASTYNKIYIPTGSKLQISSTTTMRIAKYFENGAVSVITVTERWVDIAASDCQYMRLQVLLSPSDAEQNVTLTIIPDSGITMHKDNVDTTINAFNDAGKTSSEGNPISLSGTAKAPINDISISGISAGETITLCGKNIFALIPKNVVVSGNNTRFEIDRDNGVIRALAATGTTADTPSANASTFPTEYATLNGKNWVHNFHFKFKTDTVVCITDNCSVYQPFNYLCKLQVSDGTTLWNVSDAGVTIVAKAGVMYGVRVMARTGWTGDITFRPQVEIGENSTVYEKNISAHLKLVSDSGNTNVFDLNDFTKIKQAHDAGKLEVIFNPIENTLSVKANNISQNLNVYNTNYNDGVNGKTYLYTWKGIFGALPVCMRCIPAELKGKAIATLSDGTTTWTDSGDGVAFNAEADKEYAFRITLYAGATFEYVFRPIISTGVHAYKLFGSQLGVTNIYTDGNAVLSAAVEKMVVNQQSEYASETIKRINIITGGRTGIFDRKKTHKPMVSFIDDDTTSIYYVQRYHDIFSNKGVVGNYAVMTKNLDDQPGLADLLLEYETEGFGCLYHCYYQSGNATNYFLEETRDMEQVRENFMRGLRSIREYGFSNYKHWVTPYGVNDEEIRNLAKIHGMESLIKMSLTMTSGEILTPYGLLDRWNVPRITISASSSVAMYNSLIDACAASNGWMVCVTHVNTWDNTDAMDAKLANAIQYAKDAGVSVVSYPEAFEDFKALFYLNELN